MRPPVKYSFQHIYRELHRRVLTFTDAHMHKQDKTTTATLSCRTRKRDLISIRHVLSDAATLRPLLHQRCCSAAAAALPLLPPLVLLCKGNLMIKS